MNTHAQYTVKNPTRKRFKLLFFFLLAQQISMEKSVKLCLIHLFNLNQVSFHKLKKFSFVNKVLQVHPKKFGQLIKLS